jgi:hypothetical protein
MDVADSRDAELTHPTCHCCRRSNRVQPLGETVVEGKTKYACRCGRLRLEAAADTPRPTTRRNRADANTHQASTKLMKMKKRG